MSTELALNTSELVDPFSGEVRDLASITADELKAYVQHSANVKAAIRDADEKVAEELMRRKNAGQPVAGVEVSRRNTWRSGEVGAALDKLERDGHLPTDREFYLKPEETYKAVGRNLTALLDQLVADGHLEAAEVLRTARRQSIGAKVKA